MAHKLFSFLMIILIFCFTTTAATQELFSDFLNPNKSDLNKNEDQDVEIKDVFNALLGYRGLSISGQWFLGYQAGEENAQKFNEFLLKRGYLTFEKKFSAKFSGRITSDISVDQEGDGMGDVELRLKYCYLKYQLPELSLFSNPSIEFGLVHRPWLSLEQCINDYRVQGTMFLERNRIVNTADYGFMFSSNLGGELSEKFAERTDTNQSGKIGSMAVGIYNGGGYHAIEHNQNKTLESRFTLRPLYWFLPELAFSYTNAFGKGNTEAAPDWDLHAGFVSWEHRRIILTGMYFEGTGNYYGSLINENGVSLKQKGYSTFAEVKFFRNKISLIGRYDRVSNDQLKNNGYQERYITGIVYHFIDNCKMLVDYDFTKTNIDAVKDERIFEFAVEVNY